MLPGGVSVVVRNLTRVLGNSGISNTLLISDWDNAASLTMSTGVRRLRLAIFGGFSLWGVVKAIAASPRTLFRTYRILNDAEVTGVCFHYPGTDAFGTLILKRMGLFRGRVALCFHGTDVRVPTNNIEASIWRWMFEHADGITACSKSLALDVHRVFGVPASRISVVYNGVDTSVFSPRLENESIRPVLEGKYIVSVGSFIALKGHWFLLRAYASLLHAHPEVGLVIVGGDGAERAPMEAWVDQHGLGARVKFLVDLSPATVAEVVKAAAISVQPSIAEAFGMAVIEAGACGVVVAASAVGGHMELIDHEKTGLLFPPGDAESLAILLDAYFSNPAKFTRLPILFRESILKRFTWETCVAQYNTIVAKPLD